MQKPFSNPMDRLAARLAGCLQTGRIQSPQAGPLNGLRACNPQLEIRSRSAFTLVELLVAVTILAILASLFLAALYTAQDQARTIKTRATIAKLHNIIMQRYDSYKTRRVPITIPVGTNPKVAAALRLAAVRELMRLEMPERKSEVPDETVTAIPITIASVSVTVPRPSVSLGYRRKLGDLSGGFSGAECLYAIVTSLANEDESGLEMFGPSEIGDKDSDGKPEFWDAWGNPISWMRWPAGFRSELQSGDPAEQPDPFDPRRVHPEAFALYPLIYSAGPDGDYGLYAAADTATPFSYSNNAIGIVDPYSTSPPDPLIGSWTNGDSTNAADNIHNHLIGQR